nr:uncharacterized protein LOC113802846 [Penaeus vannamei]
MVWEPATCCGINRRTAGYIIASISATYSVVILALFIYAWFLVLTRGYINKHMTVLIVEAVALMVLEAIHLIFCFLLIHGIRKNIPRLMVPFIVTMLIGIILWTLSAASAVLELMVMDGGKAVLAALVNAGIIFIMTYFNLVVRAYYMEVKARVENDFRTPEA